MCAIFSPLNVNIMYLYMYAVLPYRRIKENRSFPSDAQEINVWQVVVCIACYANSTTRT